MRTRKLPPNIDTSDNPLFPPLTDDPLQYVDTSASLIPFTHLNPSPLTWLWHQLIPIGSLTLLEGSASLGKSNLLLDLAARLSSGHPLPDPTTGLLPDPPQPTSTHSAEPSPILLITPDDPTSTRSHAFFSRNSSRPDLLFSFTNITISHILSGDRVTRPFQFTSTDLDILTREIETVHPRLIIIDPFTSTLDTDPPLKESALASLLARLNTLAATHQFACILVRTTPDRPSQATRLQRSIQPLLKASTAFILASDPLSPDHTLLVQTKTTFSRPNPILRFHLAPQPQHPYLPSLVWDGLSDLSRSELASALHLPTTSLAPTRQHILRILAQHPDPVALSTLAEALPELSYDLLRRTIRRMFKDHQVSTPSHGFYSLPTSPTPQNLPSPLSTNPVTSVTSFPNSPSTQPFASTYPVTSLTHNPSTQSSTSIHSSLSPESVTSVTSPTHDLFTPPTPFISPDPVTFVSPVTLLADHASIQPSTFTHSSLSPEPVPSVTSPIYSTLPDHQSLLPDTFSHQSLPSPTSPPAPPFTTTHTSLHFLASPPSTHRASITTHSLSNSCSDQPDPPPNPTSPTNPHPL